jgi:hypothetical protein
VPGRQSHEKAARRHARAAFFLALRWGVDHFLFDFSPSSTLRRPETRERELECTLSRIEDAIRKRLLGMKVDGKGAAVA